jgi:hypothetical protein
MSSDLATACNNSLTPSTFTADPNAATDTTTATVTPGAASPSPNIVPSGASDPCDYIPSPNANTPACQQYAQYVSMQCDFNALSSNSSCQQVAVSVVNSATAVTSQTATGPLTLPQITSTASANPGAASCINKVQQAMMEWETYENGAFANSSQGCAFLNAYVPQILQSLSGGQASTATQTALTGAVLANPTGGCTNPVNGSCSTANMIQNYLCGLNNITVAGGSTTVTSPVAGPTVVPLTTGYVSSTSGAYPYPGAVATPIGSLILGPNGYPVANTSLGLGGISVPSAGTTTSTGITVPEYSTSGGITTSTTSGITVPQYGTSTSSGVVTPQYVNATSGGLIPENAITGSTITTPTTTLTGNTITTPSAVLTPTPSTVLQLKQYRDDGANGFTTVY